MITPYKEVEYGADEIITKDSFDTVQTNLQWIMDNTPRGRYYGAANKDRAEFMVILSGRVYIGADKKSDTGTREIKFGKAFHPSCNPNVLTSVVSQVPNIFTVVNGLGNKNLPDSTGFVVKATVYNPENQKNWKISKPFYVDWIAYGYREDDVNEF